MKKRIVMVLLVIFCLGFGYMLTPLRKLAMVLQENQPIAFYARTIDQNDNPVSGVRLELGWARLNTGKALAKFPKIDMGEQEFKTNVVFSDTNGWIRLKGISGKYLNIGNLGKEGYVWDRPFDLGSLIFEPYGKRNASGRVVEIGDALDPNKGYTFHLWKKGQTELLLKVACTVSVEPHNTNWYAVNLFAGQVQDIQKGDLRFWFDTTKDANGNPARKFRFQIVDGGLLEDTNAYPFLAPEEGYKSEWDWHYEPFGRDAGQDLNELLKKKFYIKGRNGKIFAAITWNWASENGVQINGYLNPTGSRNLEPDPDKLVADPVEIQRVDEQTRVMR